MPPPRPLPHDRLQRALAHHAAQSFQTEPRLIVRAIVGLHRPLLRQPGKGALQDSGVTGEGELVPLARPDAGPDPVQGNAAASTCDRVNSRKMRLLPS